MSDNQSFEDWSADQDMLAVTNKPCDYCQPCDIQGRQFMLVFDDAERASVSFDDEEKAFKAFQKAEDRGWNCYLFATLPRSNALKFVKNQVDA